MPGLDLRLRVPSPELLALPWREPLAEWDALDVAIRDVPVGLSRHLVRFVEADGRVWALKELPIRVAMREYEILRVAEDAALPAVRPAGVVVQPQEDTALLVTHFLQGSWQYRRLLMRVPASRRKHRARLLEGISSLLVELHRNGIFWGDCSLANTLFTRDGQVVRAWLVDAETSEVHEQLTAGQRDHDLAVAVENVFGGLSDVAARMEEPAEVEEQLVEEAEGVRTRYAQLWDVLHESALVDAGDRDQIRTRLRRLNDLGFQVDEVRLESHDRAGGDDGGDDRLRLHVDVARRHFHAEQLRALTGLDAGEGQATILLADLRAYHARLEEQTGRVVSEFSAARRWVDEVLTPGIERALEVLGANATPVQAFCDLLEVRWLLSEQAGRDVGDEPALQALRERRTPPESVADLGFVVLPTEELPLTLPPDQRS